MISLRWLMYLKGLANFISFQWGCCSGIMCLLLLSILLDYLRVRSPMTDFLILYLCIVTDFIFWQSYNIVAADCHSGKESHTLPDFGRRSLCSQRSSKLHLFRRLSSRPIFSLNFKSNLSIFESNSNMKLHLIIYR